jgi:hypothetical protein
VSAVDMRRTCAALGASVPSKIGALAALSMYATDYSDQFSCISGDNT